MLATETIQDTWQVKAACRGPESRVFFPPTWPERREEREAREMRAKSICRSCAVRVFSGYRCDPFASAPLRTSGGSVGNA